MKANARTLRLALALALATAPALGLLAAGLPAQILPMATLLASRTDANGQVAVVPAGQDAWPGLARAQSFAGASASSRLSHRADSAEVVADWLLDASSLTSGGASSVAEVRFDLLTTPQAGQLVVDWSGTTTGTGQVGLEIDIDDDGVLDATSSGALPIAFGTNFLAVRVRVVATAQAGQISGPFGVVWSFRGTAQAALRLRFVPDPVVPQVLATQSCPAGLGQPIVSRADFGGGVELAAACAPSTLIACFALGLQPANVPLPLAPGCRLLVAPIAVPSFVPGAGGLVAYRVPIAPALRPVAFLAQIVTLDGGGALAAGDAVQVAVR
ncbi:MAG: hypothetical protein AB8H80_06275 [Planctomycetota bacterium]